MSEETFARFSVIEIEGGNLQLEVEGKMTKVASLLATAMDDDPDIEKAILLALVAVQARKADKENKAQLN